MGRKHELHLHVVRESLVAMFHFKDVMSGLDARRGANLQVITCRRKNEERTHARFTSNTAVYSCRARASRQDDAAPIKDGR